MRHNSGSLPVRWQRKVSGGWGGRGPGGAALSAIAFARQARIPPDPDRFTVHAGARRRERSRGRGEEPVAERPRTQDTRRQANSTMAPIRAAVPAVDVAVRPYRPEDHSQVVAIWCGGVLARDIHSVVE